MIGVSGKTLRKHYRKELDLAAIKANADVAGFLFNSAKKGNVTAQIFWLKTRAGWKEPAVDHNHRGAIGTYDLTKLSNEKLAELEAILGSAALAGGDQGREPDGRLRTGAATSSATPTPSALAARRSQASCARRGTSSSRIRTMCTTGTSTRSVSTSKR